MSALSSSYLNKLSAKEKENLFKLISLKDETKQLFGTRDTCADKTTEREPENIQSKFDQINTIKELRQQLQNEMNISKDLRENMNFLQTKYRTELESTKKENSELRELVKKLSEEFERLVLENSELTRQINYAGKIVEENEEKTQEIEKNLQNVRELVKLFIHEENIKKKKDIREQNFWQIIGGADKIIKASEPREDFPYPEVHFNNNDKFISKAEYDKLLAESKAKDNEIKKLTAQITKLSEENDKFKSSLQSINKEKNNEINTLKEQLRGAIRRINYLVEEREKLVKDEKEKNSYISKLEAKIVQQSNLKKSNSKPARGASNSRNPSPLPTKMQPPSQRTTVKTPRTLKFDNSIHQSNNLEGDPSFQNQFDFSPISSQPNKYSDLHSKQRRSILSENKEFLNLRAITDNEELEERMSSFNTMNYKFEESPKKRGSVTTENQENERENLTENI